MWYRRENSVKNEGGGKVGANILSTTKLTMKNKSRKGKCDTPIAASLLYQIQVILFEIDCTIFQTNLHELFCQFKS